MQLHLHNVFQLVLCLPAPLFPSYVSQLIPSYHFHQFPNNAPPLHWQIGRSETLTTSPDFPEPENKMKIEDHLNQKLFIHSFLYWAKKLSEQALSQQFPFLDILIVTCRLFNHDIVSFARYWLPWSE